MVFDAAKARVRGRRNRRVIKLGDRVEVEIAEVDTAMKRLDFRLAEPPKERPAKSAQRRQAKGERVKGSTTRRKRAGREKGRS